MKMPKICHLSSVHTEKDTRVFHRECVSIAHEGYETILIVPGEKDKEILGVKILTVTPDRKRLQRMIFTTAEVFFKGYSENADLYHFHDPELMFIGILFKLLGKKVVRDVHDYPGFNLLYRNYLPKIFRKPTAKIISLIDKMCIHFYDNLFVVTSDIANQYNSEKCVLVQNFPDLQLFSDPDNICYEERPEAFIYLGDASLYVGLDIMVKSIGLMDSGYLDVVGRYVPESLPKSMSTIKGWERTRSYGWQTIENVRKHLEQVRCGLCITRTSRQNIEAQPRKVFEYMAASLPVIVSDFPSFRRMLEPVGCALFVPPEDPAATAKAMQWILDNPGKAKNMGEKGRDAVLRKYNWGNESQRMLSAYKKLIGPPERI